MAKQVIINADDFGLSSAVNDAVSDAAEKGVLSSATIMANMPAFEDAVRTAARLPGLGVGVHLNFLRGTPICDPASIRSLVGRDGCFPGGVGPLLIRFLTGRVDLEHVERELSAQVRHVIDSGITPTHIDSEKHLHLFFPQVWDTVCRVANKHGIACVRVAREDRQQTYAGLNTSFKQRLKATVIRRRSLDFAKVASRHGLCFTDRFFGIAMTGRMTPDVYRTVFQSLAAGSIEIMCHPAKSTGAATFTGFSSWLDRRRVTEYRALMSSETRDALASSGARLTSYGDLR